VAAGAALPLMTLVFGASTASFSNLSSGRTSEKEFRDRVNYLVLFFVYLFVARFVITYVATLCVSVAAARTTRSIRKRFLEHMLRKEIWHFDGHSNGSIAAQVTTSGYFCSDSPAKSLMRSQMVIASIKELPTNCTLLLLASRYSSLRTLWRWPFNGSSLS
jgi:ATP-binding cassette subfamily B (MDR/TAP) protein 1